MQALESFLNQIAESPLEHARFLNTLSMLEYVGARKILKSQKAETFTLDLLAHVAEEIRHAQVLKKIALKMSEGVLTSYRPEHLYCGTDANHYIQTIDRGVEKVLSQSNVWVNYLLTTLFIEERANSVYPIYEPILSKLGYSGYLKAIVREEESHLAQTIASLEAENQLSQDQMSELRQMEAQAFDRMLSALMCQFSRQSTER